MAKFCGKCGSALNDTAIFCGGCGAKVPAASPAAFTPVQTGWAPVPSSSDPAPAIPTPDTAAFSPVPASFTPVGSTFPPAVSTPTPEAGAFTPVQGGFTPVGSTFPPAASTPTSEAGAFTPVQGGFSPVPPTPAPAQTYTPAQPAYAPIPASYTPTPGASTVGAAYPAAGAKKSNTLLKVIVALVLLIFVGGALALGGLWYAAQKINAKARSAAAKALAGNGPGSAGMNELLKGVADLKGDSGSDGSAGGFKGDPCRFLSKAEVSQAVGIQVIRVEAQDAGCSYIAKGDPADVTSKHMASMIGGLSGADAKTQKTIQQMAGGLFAQQEANDKSLRAEAATGEIPVLGVSFTSGNAQAEMKMNRGAFNYVTGGSGTAASSGSGNLDGIGDEAYLAGGSMIIFRKGNSVAHFTYISCPCNTDNIKPLAKLVASRM
jgi:hypothetical protein